MSKPDDQKKFESVEMSSQRKVVAQEPMLNFQTEPSAPILENIPSKSLNTYMYSSMNVQMGDSVASAPPLQVVDCLSAGKGCFQEMRRFGFSAKDIIKAKIPIRSLLDLGFSVSSFQALEFTLDDLFILGLDKAVFMAYPAMRLCSNWVMFYQQDYHFLLSLKMTIDDIIKAPLIIVDFAALGLTIAVLFREFHLNKTHILRLPFSYLQLRDYNLHDGMELAFIDFIRPNKFSGPPLSFDDWITLFKKLKYPLRLLTLVEPADVLLINRILCSLNCDSDLLQQLGIKSFDNLLGLHINGTSFVKINIRFIDWVERFQLTREQVDMLDLKEDEWDVLKAKMGWTVQSMYERWGALPNVFMKQIRLEKRY